MKVATSVIVALTAVVWFGGACARPLDATLVSNARDLVKPSIVVVSPSEYASYSRTLVVQGKATDLSTGGAPGKIQSLTYEILSHTSPQTLSVAANGDFTVSYSNDLAENIVVLFKAIDWNGNATELRLPLTYVGNDIPSFTSTEGSRQTTLQWGNVPGVVSYTLFFETSGKTPDPLTSPSIASVSSPWPVTQLKNGSLYSFLLMGVTADGKKNYSSVVRSIPLSTLSLFPRATPSFEGVRLDWRTYPAIGSYIVERAISPTGPWTDVSGPVATSSFSDLSAVRGQTYYYAVKPSSNSSIRSEWVEAGADEVAASGDGAVAAFDGVSHSEMSVWRANTLFIADFWYGLRIVDVTTPEIPRSLANLSISGATGLAISGNYAYITGYRNLSIVDISNPSAPSLVSTTAIEPPSNTTFQGGGIALAGNLAILSGFNEGFAVVDVTNPAVPAVRLLNQDFAGLGQNYNVAVRAWNADWLVSVSGQLKTGLYKLSGAAASPTITTVSNTVPYSRDVGFSGTVLVMSAGSGVTTYQTSTPAAPVLLGSVSPNGGANQSEGLSIAGNRAYLALSGYGFAVIDISTPSTPKVIRVRSVPGDVQQVSSGGGFLYVCTGRDYAVQIYGASDPSTASIILTKTDVSAGARLAGYRDNLYLTEMTTDWFGAIYSISNPASASRIASPVGYYSPYDYAFYGSKVVMASERSGVTDWNVSNPAAPVVTGSYVTMPNGYAWAPLLWGNYLFLGTSNSWIDVVDLSKPGSWSLVASAKTQGASSATTEVRRLALYGKWLLAANETAGLRVVDVSDPESPQVAAGYGALPGGGSAAAVALYGDYAYVADSVNGLLAYDAATINTWSGIGEARIWPASVSGGGALDVVVRGTYAYVAKGSGGLAIYDLSTPRTPVLISTLTAAGFSPVSMTIYKSYLYALDGATKLYVVKLLP